MWYVHAKGPMRLTGESKGLDPRTVTICAAVGRLFASL